MRLRNDDRGAVAIIISVFAVVMFILAAMVVDLGLARDTRFQAQNAADASALAGANALYGVEGAGIAKAVVEVTLYAAENFGTGPEDWADCVDSNPLSHVSSESACISFNSAVDPTQLRVAIPLRRVPSFLGNAFGYTGVSVSAVAVAEVAPTGGFGSPCAFCVLGLLDHEQDFRLVVNGGDVHFNVNERHSGEGAIEAIGGEITITGSAEALGGYTPAAVENAPIITDPLADLEFPDISGLPDQSATAACPVLEPGIYGNLPVSSGCTLAPGLYVVTGSLSLVGGPGTNVTATGVTLFFACGTPDNVRACNVGESGGGVSIVGQARLELTAPTSGPTAGLALLYDRQKRQDIQLNRRSTITGTIYGASARLDVRGDGCSIQPHRSLVVVRTVTTDIEDDESPCFTMLYEEDLNVFEGDRPALIRPVVSSG